MISVNVNSAASGAGLSLGKSNEALQKSLARLSSGRRIVNSSDDAGGLAVSMKMAAAQRRTDATGVNLQNIQSFLQTQDGAFTVADKVLARMSELTTLARDITKNGGDVENYDKEFGNLKAQMRSLATEKFNGVNIFFDGLVKGKTVEVPTSEDGSQVTSLTQAPINADPMLNMMTNGYKKFSIQNQTFFAERINDEAEIYKDGPHWDPVTKASTVKNIFTLPDGTSKTLNIASDPITEPTGPTTISATATVNSVTYNFGLNYELGGSSLRENLPLVYPANTAKEVDDADKPMFDSSTPPKPLLDGFGYPKYMPLDDMKKPIPNFSAGTVSVSPSTGNIVGSITTDGIVTYTTPNNYNYTDGAPIGFYENGNTSSVVYYNIATETYTTSTGTTQTQSSYEDIKGVPPFIWRQVKDSAGNNVPENPLINDSGMRWFNTTTGAYTRNLPAGGSTPSNSSSPTGFGYGVPITPPQYSATDPYQETEQGTDLVHRLLSGKINGVAAATNLNNDSTHNTNLVYENSSDYGSISQLALQQLADMRAQNGSESSRVNFSQELLKINSVNLEAANSRIMDVDIAAESSQLSRFQILQQAGTAMLAQANTSHQSLLKLLQG